MRTFQETGLKLLFQLFPLKKISQISYRACGLSNSAQHSGSTRYSQEQPHGSHRNADTRAGEHLSYRPP